MRHTTIRRTNLSCLTVVALLAYAVFLDSGCDRAAEAAEPGRFYDTTLWEGFSIKFPESWELKENFMESRVTAISPLKGKKDFFQEYVAVLSEVVPSRVTLEEYMNISLQNIHKEVRNVKVLKRGDTELGGGDAKWLSFKLKLYGVSLRGSLRRH